VPEPQFDAGALRQHRSELDAGRRFAFGANWTRYVRLVDDRRIEEAERSLTEMLGLERLDGLSVLDAGSGSGLFSLAAVRLGATVRAFDFDPDSVRATQRLLETFAPGGTWSVTHGSVLDREFLGKLGQHDIVYSWGVLHHTGAMWTACDAIAGNVGPGGTLFISLYNDAGPKSVVWRRRKQTYVRLPMGVRTLYAWLLIALGETKAFARDLREGDPGAGIRRWRDHVSTRGMSRYRDWIDWIGGYPYEFASIDETVEFFSERGLALAKVKPNSGTGTNEFVFTRVRD
jgi:2-polyprenyl-3-methyl-5-hydroxy-6-metoxy-1,4-benzoquinol methylase